MQVDQMSGRRFNGGQIQRDPEAPAKPLRIIPTPPMARVPSDGNRASAVPRPNDGGQVLHMGHMMDNMDIRGEVRRDMHVHVKCVCMLVKCVCMLVECVCMLVR